MTMPALNPFIVSSKKLIFHEKYRTREEAKKSIFDYIMTFYNYERIGSIHLFIISRLYNMKKDILDSLKQSNKSISKPLKGRLGNTQTPF